MVPQILTMRMKMTRYFRVSLGEQGKYAKQALKEGWIGTGWMAEQDLTGKFGTTHAAFRKEFNSVILATGEVKTPIAAGLACGMTFTVAADMQVGDIVLSGMADGSFQVGKVTGQYFYVPGTPLPHRRPVEWTNVKIQKEQMSPELRRSLAAGTVQAWFGYKNADKQKAFEEELANLTSGVFPDKKQLQIWDEEISFGLEEELERFLETFWSRTDFSKEYDFVKRQMDLDDAGQLDILAKSKDGKEYLIIELKVGRPVDTVIGQLQRYMGYLKTSGYCENGETVRGVIIGAKDDSKVRYALQVTNNIDFYVYEMQFNLKKLT